MRRGAVVTAFVLAVGAATVPQVNAQGFFQKLFGIGDAPARPGPSRLGVPDASAGAHHPTGTPAPWRQRSWPHRAGRRDDRRDEVGAASGGDEGKGQYQTYCVRTCDGYYFPISRAVPRRSFHKDAAACTARCGGEARLFYGPTDTDDKAAMVDLTGRVYGDLPNAFKYRKSLVSGCACRPMPWSEAELARHRAYATAEAEKTAGNMASAAPAPLRDGVALSPPVSGAGVMVMSAERDFVEQNQAAAALAAAAGLVPPTATAERPALAAALGQRVGVSAAETISADELDARDMAAAAEPRRSRQRSRRRAGAFAVLNPGGAVMRAAHHERRRRHLVVRPGVVAQAPSFWIGGGPTYVYPGNRR